MKYVTDDLIFDVHLTVNSLLKEKKISIVIASFSTSIVESHKIFP